MRWSSASSTFIWASFPVERRKCRVAGIITGTARIVHPAIFLTRQGRDPPPTVSRLTGGTLPAVAALLRELGDGDRQREARAAAGTALDLQASAEVVEARADAEQAETALAPVRLGRAGGLPRGVETLAVVL